MVSSSHWPRCCECSWAELTFAMQDCCWWRHYRVIDVDELSWTFNSSWVKVLAHKYKSGAFSMAFMVILRSEVDSRCTSSTRRCKELLLNSISKVECMNLQNQGCRHERQHQDMPNMCTLLMRKSLRRQHDWAIGWQAIHNEYTCLGELIVMYVCVILRKLFPLILPNPTLAHWMVRY